jgi:hypothetical protein
VSRADADEAWALELRETAARYMESTAVHHGEIGEIVRRRVGRCEWWLNRTSRGAVESGAGGGASETKW